MELEEGGRKGGRDGEMRVMELQKEGLMEGGGDEKRAHCQA